MQQVPTNKMRLSILLNVVLLVTATLGYNMRQNEADARLEYELFKRQYNKAITDEAEEFMTIYTNARSEEQNQEPIKIDIDDLPEAPISVDWRTKGGVGPVYNQGDCGAGWAFSVVGNIEGQWFRKTGNLLTLSKQELVDCDTVDLGCRGGWPQEAYGAIKELGGLMLESNYPYLAHAGKCNMDKSKIAVFVNDSVLLPPDEERQAAYLSEHGPLSATLNPKYLQFYNGGVLHPSDIDCSPHGPTHTVLIVGYGQDQGTPYWLVKNCWGTGWGEQGYVRVYRGDGTCGIENLVTSAIIH